MNVQPIYTNKIFKKGLEFAANKSSLFIASASLVMSTAVRPLAIMSTPKTDIENKKYACTKSLASSAVGYLIMLCASLPVSNALEKIDKNPSKFLKKNTIKTLKAGEKTLQKSKKYLFAKQLFNLGLGFVIAAPKSVMTCALIPPFMSKIFKKKNEQQKEISFTGKERLARGIGKLMDTEIVQKMSKKFHNTNFEQHIISLTDLLATGTFIVQTKNNKKIEEKRKKPLMYNAGISTVLCLSSAYGINHLIKKPYEKFVENFKKANKNSPKLNTYLDGLRVVKPALILGSIYYIAIPVISTFLADRADRNI